MKKTLLAFKLTIETVDESTGEKWPVLKLHDHPVFTGEVAYDLQPEQEIQMCEEHNVREWNSVGEAIAAIKDYEREEKEPVTVGSVVFLEHYDFPAVKKAAVKKTNTTKKAK